MGTIRDAILSASDLPYEDVATPEWAAFGLPTTRIRGMSAAQREEWERYLDKPAVRTRRSTNVRATFVTKIACDPATDELVFEPDDADKLAEHSAVLLVRLFNVGRKLSGMLSEEELQPDNDANPSEGDQGDASSSDSP